MKRVGADAPSKPTQKTNGAEGGGAKEGTAAPAPASLAKPATEPNQRDENSAFTNSVRMEFVLIPPGTFMMGSPAHEKEREANEAQLEVMLSKGYFMGIHPVTQAQWKKVMGENPSRFQGDTLPVEQVSWHECIEFCKKMNLIDGKRYRLPSEAEWEYACRAGTNTPFHFGETISTDRANFDGKFVYGNGKGGTYRQKTTPVDVFPPNEWGLCDLHGNVWEWCSDWYGIYPSGDAVDFQGPIEGRARVIRGGAWNQIPRRCRSAHRDCADPRKRRKDVGFRVCFSDG
jgi:formylglycine-generating enzyme required for sulfatase activity